MHDGMTIDMGGHEDDTEQPAAGDTGSAENTQQDEGKDNLSQPIEETTPQPEADNETEAAGTSGEMTVYAFSTENNNRNNKEVFM